MLRSVAVLRKGPDNAGLNWGLDLQPQLAADIDAHDFMELIGIALENASKWAHSRVSVTGTRREGRVELTVEDDGTGVNDEQIARLGQRGERLDQTKPGEGIGLAIAFEIARLNRGEITMSRSHLGGLAISIWLPAANSGDGTQPPERNRVLELGGAQG